MRSAPGLLGLLSYYMTLDSLLTELVIHLELITHSEMVEFLILDLCLLLCVDRWARARLLRWLARRLDLDETEATPRSCGLRRELGGVGRARGAGTEPSLLSRTVCRGVL